MINLILSIISGVLYRMGGSEKFNTNVRDIGVPCVLMFALWPENWIALFITFGLTLWSCKTGYGGEGEPKEEQSFFYRLFGKYVFFAIGFLFGISLLPIAYSSRKWIGFGLRTFILTVTFPLLNRFARPIWIFKRDQVEDFGRGFLIVSTTILI